MRSRYEVALAKEGRNLFQASAKPVSELDTPHVQLAGTIPSRQ